MENDSRARRNDPLFREAVALATTVRTIRSARGKRNPSDFPTATPQSDAVSYEFLRDVYRALGGGADESNSIDC